jgi:hypothetical protein
MSTRECLRSIVVVVVVDMLFSPCSRALGDVSQRALEEEEIKWCGERVSVR